MLVCDFNCDMGEGIGQDELIMPYISSVNIACGFHAGDEGTMFNTILLAQKYKVKIGAHPSFADRENFGRTNIHKTPSEVYHLIQQQITALLEIAVSCDTSLQHVKPHGALYNLAAKDKSLAAAIACAVKDMDENLVVFGLSGSYIISEAQAIGLKTANEVFADRTYQEDGTLTPRTALNALIEDTEQCKQQVMGMINNGKVMTVTRKEIKIIAETICIHGDGSHAVKFAKAIHEILNK